MKQQIKISYWTYPDGEEFEALDVFKKEVSNEYALEIKSEKTDAMGGGLYELALELINNINLEDFIKDYVKGFVEDGIKIGLGHFWRPLFKMIKNLFNKNEKFKPGIESLRLVFNDCEIIIYPIYSNSIDQVMDDIMQKLSEHFLEIRRKAKSKITSIHIPIFNQIDTYEVCFYRVKLNVDENIPKFSKDDYFKLWGIKCESRSDLVYDVSQGVGIQTRFYTQHEYDELLRNLWDSERANQR